MTDAEAQAWVAQTRTHDAADLVLVKHWLIEKMPPTYRTGLVFVDDSQGHGSLSAMVNEFSVWGQTFAPAPVGFQYGYQSDKAWWSTLPDPPRNIGNALLRRFRTPATWSGSTSPPTTSGRPNRLRRNASIKLEKRATAR